MEPKLGSPRLAMPCPSDDVMEHSLLEIISSQLKRISLHVSLSHKNSPMSVNSNEFSSFSRLQSSRQNKIKTQLDLYKPLPFLLAFYEKYLLIAITSCFSLCDAKKAVYTLAFFPFCHFSVSVCVPFGGFSEKLNVIKYQYNLTVLEMSK